MFRFCFDRIMNKKRYLAAAVILFAAAVWVTAASNLYELPQRNTVLFLSIISFVVFSLTAFLCFKLRVKYHNFIKLPGIIAVCIAVASCGIAYPLLYNNIFCQDIMSLDGSEALVFGTVCSEPKVSSSGVTVGFAVDTSYISADNVTLDNSGKLMAYIPSDISSDVSFGSGICFTAKISRPAENINGFGFRNYLMSRGCAAVCYPKVYELYQADMTVKDRFLYFGYTMREKIKDYAEYVIPCGDEQALLKGILLGAKDGFSDDLYNNMSGSGFMHIAAVSGLHVMFLSWFLMFMLKRLPFRLRSLLIIPVLVVFACIAGFTPSVCRAIIMMSVMLLSKVLLRDADTITSLFFAALILVLSNPYVLYSVSFILSFTATLSLLIFIRPMALWGVIAAERLTGRIYAVLIRCGFLKNVEKRVDFSYTCSRYISKLINFFTVPFSSQILMYPVSMYIFGRIGLASVLLNIIVIPCTMIIFVAGLLNFAVYMLVPAAAKLIGFVVLRIPLSIICSITAKTSDSFLSITSDQKPGVLTFVLYSILSIALYYFLTFYGEKFTKPPKSPENT